MKTESRPVRYFVVQKNQSEDYSVCTQPQLMKVSKMSFYDTAMSALDAKDFQSISELMHEDFIWMDGYDVKTLEEWLVGLKSEFEKDFKFRDRKCLYENEDICAYQHFVTSERGERLRVTNVMLLKECKVYRATVIRVPVA